MASKDYYAVLGVLQNATSDQIKAAYRQQALKWHPDRHQGTDRKTAEAKFKEINEAYQILSDPQKKTLYDQHGSTVFDQPGFDSSPFTYRYYSSSNQPNTDADFADPFEIFEQFFGFASPFGSKSKNRRKPMYRLKLSFEEAIKGSEKLVEIENKRRSIKIPAGVESGTKIRFSDFELEIEVTPSKIFQRQGYDLITEVTIPLTLAMLGGEISVPTIENTLKYKVRSGTQPDTVIRFKSKGIPVVNSRLIGDLYVKLKVAIPLNLNHEQRQQAEKLAQLL